MNEDWASEIVRRVPRLDERWLIDEEDVPETPLHDLAIDLIVQVLRAWVLRVGRDASVLRNVAVRFARTLPQVGCDPDVCVHEPAIPVTETSICLWHEGRSAPTIAVEVVSEGSAAEGYVDNPDRYAACGAGELWVFDPLLLGPRDHGGPWRLQVWSRRRDGSFVLAYAGDGPAFSERLDAWLVVTDEGRRLRVADDEEGRALWPSPEEAERAAKEAALAEIERLRAELARAQASPRRARRRP